MSLAKPTLPSQMANFSREGRGLRPPEAASAGTVNLPLASGRPCALSVVSRFAYTAPGICDSRYCFSPACGCISSKLQSKIISAFASCTRARSCSAEIRVVYMSMFLGRSMRHGMFPQHRGGNAADHDQAHADPTHERDDVAE